MPVSYLVYLEESIVEADDPSASFSKSSDEHADRGQGICKIPLAWTMDVVR